MSTPAPASIKPSATARAEAAAWLARLHGPNRTADVEAGFRRWMAESPERAAAFELLTDTWEKSARLRRRPFEQVASWELPGFRMSFSRVAFAAMAVAFLAVAGTLLYLRTGPLSTVVGEQRTLTFEDGTRVHLNTDTRITQHYDKQTRHVDLERGEALFEVAKNPQRPFIVTAGDRQVRALGTAFIVRRQEQGVSITLVEGKVTVSPVAALPAQSQAPVAPKKSGSTASERPSASVSETTSETGGSAGVFTLAPGERLTFANTRAPQLDTPSLERVTAWQRGQVALDNTSLTDAVAEMNRYNTARIVIDDERVGRISVSGIFRAGDSENFARAVAKTYHLRIVAQPDEIVLSK